MGDGIVDPITSVAISFGGETKAVALAAFVNPVIVGGQSFTITGQADGSVIVSGLVSNASIATYTADGFNSLEVAYVSGNAFIMTGFGTASVLSAPVSFNVPVELVDADGDAAASILRDVEPCNGPDRHDHRRRGWYGYHRQRQHSLYFPVQRDGDRL